MTACNPNRASKPVRALAFLLLIATMAAGQEPGLAHFNGDSIEVYAFMDAYPAYLQRSDAVDSLATRLDYLNHMIGQRLVIRYGWKLGYGNDPAARLAGYLAWRNTLADQVGRRHVMEEVSSQQSMVEETYNFEQTALHTRAIQVPDSLTGLHALSALAAGQSFKSLAWMYAPAPSILATPWDSHWATPHQLDPAYAKAAYAMQPGDVSEPVRVAGGFVIIHLLAKNYSPDHGHFERIKRQQVLAELIGDPIDMDRVYRRLRLSVAANRVRMSKRRMRKVMKSRALLAPDPLQAAAEADPSLPDIVLATVNKRPYTLSWFVEHLDHLPPDPDLNFSETAPFQDVINELLMIEHMLNLVVSLPDGEHWMAVAERARVAALDEAVYTRAVTHLMEVSQPADSVLAALWGSDSTRYYRRPGADIQELAVAGKSLADKIDSLLINGKSLTRLAERYTIRDWARKSRGRLGWVPANLYGVYADSISRAYPGTLMGPVEVENIYIFLKIWESRPGAWISGEELFERLRIRWREEAREAVLGAWTREAMKATYPVSVNLSVLEGLSWPEENLPPLVMGDAATLP